LGSAACAGYSLHSMPLWSMKSKREQAFEMAPWDSVMTVEDHLADAGFGSWLRESLQDAPHLMVRLSVRALDAGVSGMVGSQGTLNTAGGLSAPT
jgi:transketolase